MTGPSLDLDALREALTHLDRASTSIGCVTYYGERLSVGARDTIVRETRAVLALVEEQRARISTLEEALRRVETLTRDSWRHTQIHELAVAALAGSPAENKEPS